MEKAGIKVILLIALILYVVSPVDLVPGPFDDAILMMCYAIGARAAHNDDE
jgi:uncharacterized membrane protein YkvA (DUF1232 family)